MSYCYLKGFGNHGGFAARLPKCRGHERPSPLALTSSILCCCFLVTISRRCASGISPGCAKVRVRVVLTLPLSAVTVPTESSKLTSALEATTPLRLLSHYPKMTSTCVYNSPPNRSTPPPCCSHTLQDTINQP
jgi:hypothetical protein